jgi:hypothetical protein
VMKPVDVSIQQHVHRVYDLLVEGHYTELERLTRGVRLSAAEIEMAVSSYPFTLKPWPIQQPIPIDVIEVENAERRSWSIRAPAFTLEEGRSDLSLELTLMDAGSHRFAVQFDDIHVL